MLYEYSEHGLPGQSLKGVFCGLPGQSLKGVFCATVIGRMMYHALALHGFCLASDHTQLNSFLRRAVKLSYYDKHSATFSDLFQDVDDAFFGVYCIIKHVLHT